VIQVFVVPGVATELQKAEPDPVRVVVLDDVPFGLQRAEVVVDAAPREVELPREFGEGRFGPL